MRNIILLGLTSLLTDISTEMVYPILPFFLVSSLGATPAVLGLIEGAAESLASLLKVFSGFISDRFRRRKPLTILGYSGSTLGKLLLYAAGSWGVVFAARIVDRFGKGIRTAPRDALIVESNSGVQHGRAFGLHRALDNTGAAMGVALAILLVTVNPGNYGRIFAWSILPAVLGVLLLFLVREQKPPEPRSGVWTRPSLRNFPPQLRMFLVISLIFSLGNSSNTFLLLRAGGGPLDTSHVLLLYLVYNIVHAVVSYPAGRISDRIGRKHVLIAGYGLFSVVYFGFAFLVGQGAPGIVWVLFVLYGLFSAFTDGVEKALVSDLAPTNVRATAIGLHAMLVGIGLFPASFIAGALWGNVGPEAALSLGGITGLLAAVAMALVL
jgi:MFS family permease